MTPADECEVCRASSSSASDYFAMAFGDPGHWAATGESVADTFGFCPRHGAQLLSEGSLLRGMAEVFKNAIARVLPLLIEQRFGDEGFQRVYFSARDTCPACAYESRISGRQAASLRRRLIAIGVDAGEPRPQPMLCGRHFQAVTRRFRPAARMPAIAGRIEVLESLAPALEDLTAGGADPRSTFDEGTVTQALTLICGCAEPAIPTSCGTLLGKSREPAKFEQVIACPDVCPVCVAVEAARLRWLSNVRLAALHGLDGWLFLPTCPEHVADVARLGTTSLTVIAAGHALHVETEHLHQQLGVLIRAAETEEELNASRIARWGRRRRRRKSASPRPPVPRLVRCAACERLAIAELQATAKLLRLLHGERHRRAFEGGYGLCMKHHAQAYLLAPRGEVRSLLATDQARRLSDLQRALTVDTEGQAARPTALELDSDCLLELRRFCGFG